MSKHYAKTVQSLTATEFETLISLCSFRELPEATRKALRFRHQHGYTLESAGFICGVSRQRVSAAENKLVNMHNKILKGYLHDRQH